MMRSATLPPIFMLAALSASALGACSDTGRQTLMFPVATPDGSIASAMDAAVSSAAPGSDAGAAPGPSRLDAGASTGQETIPQNDAATLFDSGSAAFDGGSAASQSDAGPISDASSIATDWEGGAADGSTMAAACTGTPLSVGDHEYTIQSKNGLKYSYILSVPSTVDPSQRAPLLVHWHALSSDPEEARKLTSIDAKGAAAKALLVYPRSPDKSWDVGTCCTTTVSGTRRDEEVFARELIKDVLSKACVDEKRIYTNGFSNGGMISQMLACKMGDVFAASAPMGSTLTIPTTDCKPSRPVPIFMLNGTADPLVGYNSSGTSGGLSVPEDVKFWADKNGCTGTPETFLTKGKVTCKRYTQCSAGAEVAHCAVEGMGHCVPGMKTASPTNCLTKTAFGIIPIQLGMPNDDIDGLQMDVDFLLRFTLP